MYKGTILYFFMETYGVGKYLAIKMCKEINVSPLKEAHQIHDLKKDQAFSFLKKNNYKTSFQLKNKELDTLIYYDKINNSKGFKFRNFLPINGQRNATNGKTAKKQAKILQRLMQERVKKQTQNDSKKKVVSSKKRRAK